MALQTTTSQSGKRFTPLLITNSSTTRPSTETAVLFRSSGHGFIGVSEVDSFRRRIAFKVEFLASQSPARAQNLGARTPSDVPAHSSQMHAYSARLHVSHMRVSSLKRKFCGFASSFS